MDILLNAHQPKKTYRYTKPGRVNFHFEGPARHNGKRCSAKKFITTSTHGWLKNFPEETEIVVKVKELQQYKKKLRYGETYPPQQSQAKMTLNVPS